MEKEKKLVSENVIQGNKISRASYNLETNEQQLATFAMFKINKVYQILNNVKDLEKRTKLSDYKASFTTLELCKTLGINHTKNSNAIYTKTLDGLSKKICKLTEGNKKKWLPLIIYSEFNKDTKQIEIVFNPYFFKEIFDPEKYSKGNLKVFGSLTQSASQRLYFFLLSYKNMKGRYQNKKEEWKIEIKINELREMYNIPKDKITRTNNLIFNYVKKPVEEINEKNFEFSITYETVKKGRSIDSVIFTCVNLVKQIPLNPADTQIFDNEKIELNNEANEIAYFKKTYRDEWNTLYQDEIAQKNLFKLDEKSKEVFAISAVYAKMKKLHPKG
jgi:hypothetical protein